MWLVKIKLINIAFPTSFYHAANDNYLGLRLLKVEEIMSDSESPTPWTVVY